MLIINISRKLRLTRMHRKKWLYRNVQRYLDIHHTLIDWIAHLQQCTSIRLLTTSTIRDPRPFSKYETLCTGARARIVMKYSRNSLRAPILPTVQIISSRQDQQIFHERARTRRTKKRCRICRASLFKGWKDGDWTRSMPVSTKTTCLCNNQIGPRLRNVYHSGIAKKRTHPSSATKQYDLCASIWRK